MPSSMAFNTNIAHTFERPDTTSTQSLRRDYRNVTLSWWQKGWDSGPELAQRGSSSIDGISSMVDGIISMVDGIGIGITGSGSRSGSRSNGGSKQRKYLSGSDAAQQQSSSSLSSSSSSSPPCCCCCSSSLHCRCHCCCFFCSSLPLLALSPRPLPAASLPRRCHDAARRQQDQGPAAAHEVRSSGARRAYHHRRLDLLCAQARYVDCCSLGALTPLITPLHAPRTRG